MKLPHLHRKLIGLVVLLLALGSDRAFTAADVPVHGPKMIMIIRHAEKPDETGVGEKNPDLSKRGFERADALAKVIPANFGHPDFLIATKKTKGSNRPVETITPLSKAINEEIESTFADDEFDQVAKEVLTDPKFDGKIVLIAWHHGKIPELAKALGAKDVPDKWDPKVFDRVWELTFDGGAVTRTDLPQKAPDGDSEK